MSSWTRFWRLQSQCAFTATCWTRRIKPQVAAGRDSKACLQLPNIWLLLLSATFVQQLIRSCQSRLLRKSKLPHQEKSKERKTSQHSENGRVLPETASLWHEGKDQWDSPARQREIPPLRPVVRLGPKGHHQVQTLSSCPIYKAGSSLSRTSSIGTAGSWEVILPKGLGFAARLAKSTK